MCRYLEGKPSFATPQRMVVRAFEMGPILLLVCTAAFISTLAFVGGFIVWSVGSDKEREYNSTLHY